VAGYALKNYGDYSSGYCPGLTPDSLLSRSNDYRAGTITGTNIRNVLLFGHNSFQHQQSQRYLLILDVYEQYID
jgi:hypothetical protein